MKAAVLESAPGELVIDEITVAKPQGQEVLVQTLASGLCHSDLHVMEGLLPSALPSVMGHEAAGLVEAVGPDVVGLEPGDLVVSCLTMFCGHCGPCRAGRSYLCTNRRSLASRSDGSARLSRGDESVRPFAGLGGFAEMMLVHNNAVVKVPKELPPDMGALLGCGVLTGIGSVIRGAEVKPGSTVAVVGCGGIGLNIVQGAQLAGASRIIAVDLHDEKLALAATFGATDSVNATSANPVEAVLELTGGGVDYAFEAIGLPATARQAFDMVAPGRDAYLVGVPPAGAGIELPGTAMTLQAKGIKGLFMGMSRFTDDIPLLADLYMQGRIKLDELVSATISIEDVNKGYEVMKGGTEARSVIVFN